MPRRLQLDDRQPRPQSGLKNPTEDAQLNIRHSPSHPRRAQQLCLREHGLHGFFLQVRRVAVFVQDAPNEVRMQKCELRSSVSSAFRIRHSTFAPFVLEQFLQQLGGDVLVLEAAHSGEELVAQDATERACGATETDCAKRWAKPD